MVTVTRRPESTEPHSFWNLHWGKYRRATAGATCVCVTECRPYTHAHTTTSCWFFWRPRESFTLPWTPVSPRVSVFRPGILSVASDPTARLGMTSRVSSELWASALGLTVAEMSHLGCHALGFTSFLSQPGLLSDAGPSVLHQWVPVSWAGRCCTCMAMKGRQQKLPQCLRDNGLPVKSNRTG